MQCTLNGGLCKEKRKSQLENSEPKNMYSQTTFLKSATRIAMVLFENGAQLY